MTNRPFPKPKLILLLLGLLALTSVVAAAGSISVSQSVDKTQIPFADSVKFEIKLTWQGGQAAYRFEKPLEPYFDRMKIGAFASSISSTGTGPDEVTTKTYRYTLIPTSGGIGQIDAVTVGYISWPDSIPGELITEPLTVNIAQPVIEKPSGSFSTPIIIGIVAGLIILALVIVVIIRRLQPTEPVISAKEKFLEALTELKSDAGSDIKRFTNGLVDLLTIYISEEFGITIDRFDQAAVVECLGNTKLAPSQKEQIGNWLARFHADKFKPVTANPGDTIRLESEIREFFGKL
jgi:hypothetical protein